MYEVCNRILSDSHSFVPGACHRAASHTDAKPRTDQTRSFNFMLGLDCSWALIMENSGQLYSLQQCYCKSSFLVTWLEIFTDKKLWKKKGLCNPHNKTQEKQGSAFIRLACVVPQFESTYPSNLNPHFKLSLTWLLEGAVFCVHSWSWSCNYQKETAPISSWKQLHSLSQST